MSIDRHSRSTGARSDQSVVSILVLLACSKLSAVLGDPVYFINNQIYCFNMHGCHLLLHDSRYLLYVVNLINTTRLDAIKHVCTTYDAQ